jgi:hypothetical protein
MANSNASIATRMAVLRAGLAALVDYRNRKAQEAIAGTVSEEKTRWENPAGRLSMIFVAPEYMFMNACQPHLHNVTDDRFLGLTERNDIINALTDISKTYDSQLIFVPGSIAFKKPFYRQGDTSEILNARYSSVFDRIESGAAQFVSPTVNLEQAKAYSLSGQFQAGSNIYNALTTIDKLSILNTAIQAQDTNLQIGENKMYMFHRGKAIATYKKKCDFHEVLPGYPQPTIFVPGEKRGRATVGGVSFGLEICLDHCNGTLSSAGSSTGDLPVVHAVASAWVSLQGGNTVVRPGGYMVHASSNKDCSGIWRRGTGANAGGFLEGDKLDIVATTGGGQMNMAVAEIDFA